MAFWDFLTQPSQHITDVGDYRKARLLSVLTLLLLFLFIILILIGYITIEKYRLAPADLASYVVLLATYGVSRTKYYQLGVVLASVTFPFNVFANILQGTTQNPANTINFLVFSYVFVGIFLPLSWTGLYSFLLLAAIWLLPYLSPQTLSDPSVITPVFFINMITALLLLVSMYQRDRIEEERKDELRITYDNTLAGWSRALEFRDKETKGHSQRVTELSLKLASRMGITDKFSLQHIRRGALLHDVGKMAISNQILLKIDPLTEEEWEQIHLHPVHAYQMLKDIPFLIPALDIPYYHHEKWDGTGYPTGLAGEAIPLAARIFAVADVWDALRSERPYRGAWSSERALDYIRDQRKKHFDPAVVDKFVELLDADDAPNDHVPGEHYPSN